MRRRRRVGDGDGDGDGVNYRPPQPGGIDPPNYAFVTKAQWSPKDLGGLAGADMKCADAAAAAASSSALPTGLTWIAYLSLPGQDINVRIAASGLKGWLRTDAMPLAGEFYDGSNEVRMISSIGVNEDGDTLSEGTATQRVVTGTTLGVAAGSTCGDFDDNTLTRGVVLGGYAHASGRPFESISNVNCTGLAHLMYLSLGNVTRAGANIMCQTEASKAGLPGNYLALISGDVTTGASFFDRNGENWVRPDGLPIFSAATDLDVVDTALQMPMNLTPIAIEFALRAPVLAGLAGARS